MNRLTATLVVLLALIAGTGRAQEMALTGADSVTMVAPEVDIPSALDLKVMDTWSTGVNPTGAVLMTPLFPGWGQLYTENSWRAGLAFGVEMFYWTNMLMRDRRAVRAKEFGRTFAADDPNRARYDAIAAEDWEQVRDFAWWSGGVLLIIALDAYVGAHLFHFDEDPVPVPNAWDSRFDTTVGSGPGFGEGPTLVVFQHAWKF